MEQPPDQPYQSPFPGLRDPQAEAEFVKQLQALGNMSDRGIVVVSYNDDGHIIDIIEGAAQVVLERFESRVKYYELCGHAGTLVFRGP